MIRAAVTPHSEDEAAYLAQTQFFIQFDQSAGAAATAEKLAISGKAGMEEAQRDLSAFYNGRIAQKMAQIIAVRGTALPVQDHQMIETAIFHAVVPETLKRYIQREPLLPPPTAESDVPPTDWERLRQQVGTAGVMQPRILEAVLGNVTTLQNLNNAIARVDRKEAIDLNGTMRDMLAARNLDPGHASEAINRLLAQPRSENEPQTLSTENREALANQAPFTVAYAAEAMITSITGQRPNGLFVPAAIDHLKLKPHRGRDLIDVLDSLATERSAREATDQFVGRVVAKIDTGKDGGNQMGDAISALQIWEQRKEDADRLRMLELLRSSSLAGLVSGIADRPVASSRTGARTESLGDIRPGTIAVQGSTSIQVEAQV